MNDQSVAAVSPSPSWKVRAALFAGVCIGIFYTLVLIRWTTIYLTIPILVPFLPYTVDPYFGPRQVVGNPTVSTVCTIAYVVGIATLAAFWSRRLSLPAAIAVYAAVVVGLAAVVDLLFWLFGVPFFMETP